MRRFWSALLLAALAVTACGGTATPAAPTSSTPYRVLFMGGTSSFVAGPAKAQLSGITAAAAILNRSGGILGHKIQIESIDTGADATKATSLLIERLGSGPQPDLVIPGTTSAETLAMLPTLTKNKILGVSESASAKLNDPTNYPYGFSVSVGPILPASALIAYVQKQGYKKVAIIGGNDAFGTSGVAAAAAAATAAGLTVAQTTFPAAALDVTPQLDQLKSQSPDVLLYTSNGTQISALMKSRAKLGWNIPTISDLGTGSGDIWQLAGGDPAAGTYAMVYPVQPYVEPAKRSKPLSELFTELQKIGIPPFTSGLTIYALAWDIMNLVNTAAVQANSVDGVKVANALENLKQPSSAPWIVFKNEGFSKTVHFLAPPVTEFKVIKVGPQVDGMVKAA